MSVSDLVRERIQDDNVELWEIETIDEEGWYSYDKHLLATEYLDSNNITHKYTNYRGRPYHLRGPQVS